MKEIILLVGLLVVSLFFYAWGFSYPIEGIFAPYALLKMVKISRKFRLNGKKH